MPYAEAPWSIVRLLASASIVRFCCFVQVSGFDRTMLLPLSV